MEDLIKIKNTSYAKYEEVLLRRDNLRKEAEQIHINYIKEFGELIKESFELKVECIKKKKEIAFCQRLANQGKKINRNDLIDYIEKAMMEYYAELDSIIKDVKYAKESRKISPSVVRKIKEIYYRLAKIIHPDMHPEYADDEVLQDYWNRISIAYQYNCLDDIEELEEIVKLYLEKNYNGTPDFEIKDIDAKIMKVEEEIDEITSNNPYLYKLLLTSKTAVKEKRKEYQEEIESYKKYSKQLDEVLETFEIEEMLS